MRWLPLLPLLAYLAPLSSAETKRLGRRGILPGARKVTRWVLLVIPLIVVLIFTVVLVRVAGFRSHQVAAPPMSDIAVDEALVAQHLATAISIPTVARGPGDVDTEALRRLQAALAEMFPATHRSLHREVVADYSLLYRWNGTDPSLRPIVLLAHLDVVPVEPGIDSAWKVPPFEGRIADGFVWGRGARDDKSSLIAILEAVETLLDRGFQPRRTIYLAFGHDEEVGGLAGGRKLAEVLTSRNIKAALLLDEGAGITRNIVPGLAAPVALVAIAEKGYLTVELIVDLPGGHASVPPPQSAIGVLAAALTRLEAHPMPRRLDGPTRASLDTLGREMSFPKRLVFANLWLFGGLVERQAARVPATDALTHTTTAATIFEGGIKDNVLPSHVRAVLNFRILQGDTIAGVLDHVRRVVGDGRVSIRATGGCRSEPSPLSDTSGPAFALCARTIRQVFHDAIVVPTVAAVMTDARHYAQVSGAIYRFEPQVLTSDDLPQIHGTDERISVAELATGVRFYAQFLLNTTGPEAPSF